ncbi:VCBS repeat-containing protein [Streptomyces sp. Tu 2975]|uniref:FG-GAP repeat domain-containing protein n=1 Tax=Streptomyces sp. Tu 2975 TaxID=2676871 RepID=UPI001359374E|nr:VCBS repeat-containing protein [Streptomyces sp. Tu 2975]QIP87839.1 VCBS repeat-containing protein [Streptomyces sp. Tu 2975]
MKHARTTRQRMTAAMAIGAAVCAATSAVPAAAAPPTETVASDAATGVKADATNLQLEPGAEVISAGPIGFASSEKDGDVRWTRYADGSSILLTRLDGQAKESEYFGAFSDTVVMPQSMTEFSRYPDGATVYEPASGAAPVTIDLRTLSRSHRYVGAVADVVIAASAAADGERAHLVTRNGTSLSDRAVTGLPAGALDIRIKGADAGAVLLSYRTGELEASRWHLALVDLTTAAVTQTYGVGAHAPSPDAALSGTHIAWFEATAPFSSTMILNVAERGSSAPPRREAIRGLWKPVINLTGNWLTYASASDLRYGDPQHRLALTAVPVTGGPSRKLLEQVSTIVPSPDGSLLAMGGTLSGGQGLYRIAPTATGTPTATLVASTGEPTAVTVIGHTVPSVIDLDKNRGAVPLAWRLSRLNVTFTATIRHTRTGLAQVAHLAPGNGPNPDPQRVDLIWDGLLHDGATGRNAPNGAYTWTVEATPTNGIGPTATATGTFTVQRKAAPHDFTDNGSPDILARDNAGRLWLEDTASSPEDLWRLDETRTRLVGGGWQIYNSIEATGNLAGGAAGDLVARDRAGGLWLYQGRGDGTFAGRVKIGGGWQDYTHLAGIGDGNRDGRPDLFATTPDGVAYFYQGTGSAAAPFRKREASSVFFGTTGSYNHIA